MSSDSGPASASPSIPASAPGLNLGRYTLYDAIAQGGMASVHLARLRGSVGFSRVVAVKRIHPHIAREPDFVAMFLDEARLASRVRHPNVVSVLDVARTSSEVFLVMEYIVGESLSALQKKQLGQGERIPLSIAVHLMCDVLHGLHAAHEATDERGEPLGIVHRDVSPHNILVGTDGVARLVDFGVAKAAGRLYTTRSGELKGKLGYMAPEQLRGERVTRAADIYSAGVSLWELLTGRRMIEGDSEAELVLQSVSGHVPSPHEIAPDVPERLSAVVTRAVARSPRERYATALAFLEDLESATERVSARQVGAWVSRVAESELASRKALVTRVESGPLPVSQPPTAAPIPAAETTSASPRSGARKLALAALGLVGLLGALWLAGSRRGAAPAPATLSAQPASSLPAVADAPAPPVVGSVTLLTGSTRPAVKPLESAAGVNPRPAPKSPASSVRSATKPSPAPETSSPHVPDDLLGRF